MLGMEAEGRVMRWLILFSSDFVSRRDNGQVAMTHDSLSAGEDALHEIRKRSLELEING